MHQNTHMEVLAASQNWIAGFNRGDLAAMVRGYAKNASMHPRPNPLCSGQAEIESFGPVYWPPVPASWSILIFV